MLIAWCRHIVVLLFLIIKTDNVDDGLYCLHIYYNRLWGRIFRHTKRHFERFPQKMLLRNFSKSNFNECQIYFELKNSRLEI